MNTKTFMLAGFSALLGLAACVAPPTSLEPVSHDKPFQEDPTKDPAQQPGVASAGEKNTYNHSADLGEYGAPDPFTILAQREAEGPAEVRTRLHSCQKIQYAALANILTSLGVDLTKQSTPPSAGQLFQGGASALGVADYDARVGEAIVWSAAGAAKLFDIFVQAAPEIIANIPSAAQCTVNGVGVTMFNADSTCNADALACLMGRPASQSQVDVCSHLVLQGSDIQTGQNIAVATVLAATHSCE